MSASRGGRLQIAAWTDAVDMRNGVRRAGNPRHRHVKGFGLARNLLADGPETDQHQMLAGKVIGRGRDFIAPPDLVPLGSLYGAQLADEAEHQGDGMLGHGEGPQAGRIGHDHAGRQPMSGRAVDPRCAELDPAQRFGIGADGCGILRGVKPVAGDQDFRFRQHGGDGWRIARAAQLGPGESLQGVFKPGKSAAGFQENDTHVLARD